MPRIAELSAYANNGPIIAPECAGAYPQPEAQEDNKTGEHSKYSTSYGDWVDFVDVVNGGRRW